MIRKLKKFYWTTKFGKMKKLFFVIGLIGLLFINTTCSKEKLFHKITWEGKLFDSIGGNPASNVWITLHACDSPSGKDQCSSYIVGQSVTDETGHFKIHNRAARSDRYMYRVSADKITVNHGDFRLSENELKEQSTIYIVW